MPTFGYAKQKSTFAYVDEHAELHANACEGGRECAIAMKDRKRLPGLRFKTPAQPWSQPSCSSGLLHHGQHDLTAIVVCSFEALSTSTKLFTEAPDVMIVELHVHVGTCRHRMGRQELKTRASRLQTQSASCKRSPLPEVAVHGQHRVRRADKADLMAFTRARAGRQQASTAIAGPAATFDRDAHR